MRTIFHTKVYLSAAVLVLSLYSAGPASADRQTVGNLPPFANQQLLTTPFSPSIPPDATESNVRPDDVGDFGPGPDFRPTPLPDTKGDHDTVCPAPDSDDPQKSAQMMLLWDAWHKRVAETIYLKFNESAQILFKHIPPLTCQISYMVAKDGRIGNVRVLQPSVNVIFNTMLITIIRGMQGNPNLEFPPGSRRQFVEKTATFTWNHKPGGCDFPPELPPHIGSPALSK
jgi:hypothetical protein